MKVDLNLTLREEEVHYLTVFQVSVNIAHLNKQAFFASATEWSYVEFIGYESPATKVRRAVMTSLSCKAQMKSSILSTGSSTSNYPSWSFARRLAKPSEMRCGFDWLVALHREIYGPFSIDARKSILPDWSSCQEGSTIQG
jgi:hypothetical protein